MDLKEIDIVYFVKESEENEELRYSLRSVAKNFPHRKIWFYGGKPHGLFPDESVQVMQSGKTKWDRVQSMFREACLNDEITEDFVLFNDDFFVMSPVDELPFYYRGSLYEHIVKLEMNYNDKPTEYSLQLRNAARALENAGLSHYSYELHIPMLFNRHKMLETLGAFPGVHCVRTLYGNFCNVGGQVAPDVKVFKRDQTFNSESIFLSTQDNTFGVDNEITKFIKEKFPDKCKYEKLSLS